ncbi:hypothetical protein [Paenibacillus sp. FSL R7-0331]|uniref:hypothetical protein n=1 Tax=Paenibacillus sp. FSL R7-0331 TaxID=1536773 RepID=UPI001E617D0F|nr:hypothetical protein [Paenibacillus sp. FSL R7-0331]
MHQKVNIRMTLSEYRGVTGKLDWLEYSVKRSLGVECTDEAEQQLGADQVIGTIESLNDYAAFIPVCMEWLAEVSR